MVKKSIKKPTKSLLGNIKELYICTPLREAQPIKALVHKQFWYKKEVLKSFKKISKKTL